jgi:hypothetical protein
MLNALSLPMVLPVYVLKAPMEILFLVAFAFLKCVVPPALVQSLLPVSLESAKKGVNQIPVV